MRSKLFLIVLILAMAALSGTVCANVLQNPSFEEGDWSPSNPPDDWSTDDSGGTVYWWHDPAGAHEGNYYISFSDGDDPKAYTGLDWPCTPGETWYAGAWVKGPVTKECEIRVEYDAGTDGYLHFTSPSQTEWTYVEGSFVVPAGATMTGITIVGLGSGEVKYDSVWFDTFPPGGAASGVHSPNPQDGEAVVPGTDTVAWMRQKGQQGDNLLCTLYWSGGASDVNDLNFDVKVPSPVATFVDQDANSVYLPDHGLSVVIDKNYYWRVDTKDPNGDNWGADTLVSPIWMFTTINGPPVVDAGPKQNAWLPDGGGTVIVPLAGEVTDDVLPVGGSLDPYWEKLSGPGTAIFSDPCILDPTVTLNTVGDYELKLTVNDGDLDGSDTVKIRVFDFANEGLLARYDCEEGDAAVGIHDDYSGYAKNPGDPNPPCRRGERMDDIDTPGTTGTTMLPDEGHNAQPEQDPCDLTLGGIQFDGEAGHVYCSNSDSDPNLNPWSNWPGPSWADLQDEVSLMAWIKVDPDTGWDNNWESIISKGNAAGYRSYRLERNGSGAGTQMAIDIDDVVYVASGTTSVNDGQWHHVAGTYDGAEVCIYVDGLKDVCVEAEGTMPLADAPLTIGEAYANPSDPPPETGGNVPFGGVMDEIRIHDVGIPWNNAQAGAVSIVKIYRDTGGHTNCGGVYLTSDANEDCFVNIADVKMMAEFWTECNSIANPTCD